MWTLKTIEKKVSKQKRYALFSTGIIIIILFLDQLIKIWVKTRMTLGENIPLLGNWFNLYFVENEGMAFGISLGQNFGKLLLSLLRITLVIFLCVYLFRQIKKEKVSLCTITIFSMIIAGALGNIVDCLFYGLIFNESTFTSVASLWPPEGGYAPFFYGRVVDMFYLRLFHIPDGFPLWGGSYFFPAIFNFADTCITIGIFLMLIFSKRIFKDFETKEEKKCSETEEHASIVR